MYILTYMVSPILKIFISLYSYINYKLTNDHTIFLVNTTN